jgi:hypothetical protein
VNALLEQGRIVTWLDRNSEYADDLDAVQELLDDATLITINANLFETNSASLQKTPNLATRPSSNPARVLPTSRSTSLASLTPTNDLTARPSSPQ